MAASQPRLSASETLLRIAHLEDLRRAFVDGGEPLPEITTRLLLDTLGLGNRQVFDFLAASRPTQEEFERWVIATAGLPDPELVARYTAVVEAENATGAGDPEVDRLPDVLSEADLAQWEHDGYVVLRHAIPREACADAAQLIWDFLDASPDDPDSWYGKGAEGIMVPVYQHPALEVARRSPRVRKAFAQLWGRSDLWVTIDQMGFNPPETGSSAFKGSDLHWDVSLARPIPFATQALVYLTDTRADQGAFRCVPGFHHRLGAWLESLDGQAPREVDLSNEAVCIPGRAGDLVIWRQDLPHGASPNRADRPRLVQYLNFYPPDLVIADRWR